MDRSKPCWRYEWFWRKPAVVGLYLCILGASIWLFWEALTSASGIELESVIVLSVTAAICVVSITVFGWYIVKDLKTWTKKQNS